MTDNKAVIPFDPVADREKIIEEIGTLVRYKYDKGYLQYGGDLDSKSPLKLLYETQEELADALVYIRKAINKLESAND